MPSTSLQIGSAGYDLLDSLNLANGAELVGSKATVSRSGSSSFSIRSKPGGTSIDDLSIGTPGSMGVDGNSTTSIFASLNNFEASLGAGRDNLNIFGNVAGARIALDTVDWYESTPNDGNDQLNIYGNLNQGNTPDGTNDINRIYAGSGNDTIRITGQANDAFIYLGQGNDSLSVGGTASNLDIKAGSGNDVINFAGAATDVSVAGGTGNDSVIFNNKLISSDPGRSFANWSDGVIGDGGQPSFELQSGNFLASNVSLGEDNDFLVLNDGTQGPVAINTGSGYDTIQLKGDFTSTQFILDGRNEWWSPTTGADRITSSPNASFLQTSFISNNSGGDTLIFSNGTNFATSTIELGSAIPGMSDSGGNDSVVFGNNAVITNSTIDLGGGGDTLIFGQNTTFYNTQINLGADYSNDQIKFTSLTSDNKQQLTITGGGVGDTLYIGAVAYTYNTVNNDFYNAGTWWKA